MKKLGFISAFMLFFFIANATGFADDNKLSMQLLVSGVMGYGKNPGMNSSAKNSAQEDVDLIYSLYSARFDVDSSTANWPKGGDIDFRYFFDNIGLGLELGYHITKAEAKATHSNYLEKTTSTFKLSVIPVVATLYYKIDLESSNNFILLGGGVGYYFGNMNFDYKEEIIPSSWPYHSSSNDYKQSKVGYHVLVEYDYVMDVGFTFFAGMKYRYVKFDEFKDGSYILHEYGTSKNLKAGLTGVALYLGAGMSF
ncbi:MAG: hypothetical protein FWF73_01975 [Spirochaetes bacterium]|nr:hypothetical protein [Spirochaetota bacterium]